MNITHWLKKTPQPVTVQADDKVIPVPKNARAYRDLTATIKALAPSKLTCLDKDGNVLRVVTLEDEEEERAPLTADQSDLQLFAKLIAEAYDKGSKANQPLVDAAMQFCDGQGQRLAKADAEIERLRAHIHKLNLKIGELQLPTVVEEAGTEDSIVGAMVAGVMQAQAAMGTPVTRTPVTPIKSGAKKP